MVQHSSPFQEAVVVARTRVNHPRQGMGKRPFGITNTGDQSITLDVCSELASHDACVSLLIDHLTGGLINVLVFVALQFDTAYHYSVASSHQQRFRSY
jgi:hypothetical protein